MTEVELYELRDIDKNLKSNLRQKRELEALKTSIPSPSDIKERVQTSIVQSNLENTIIRLADLENVISKQIIELSTRKYNAKLEFMSLPIKEKMIMELRYLECQSWETIAYNLGYSISRVKGIHKDAKNKILAS